MTSRINWVPDRRDVIWIDCNPQVGKEMKDIHPFLVFSPKAFNERTNLVIGLPIASGLPTTTASSNETNPFAVKFVGPKGLVSYVLAHQPKSYDWKLRAGKLHPMRQVPSEIFELACETLNQIIAIA